MAGAKLYLYDSVSTTTPKTAYTDNALAVAHAFPIVADSAGVFAQIFATSGTAFYATLKTSAGATVQSFTFMTALGADDATLLSKDFNANGRFQVRGASGIAQIEVGDPLGDDVGGSGRIGGWAGTAGVTLTLDFATVNTTGALTANGVAVVSTAQAIAFAVAL